MLSIIFLLLSLPIILILYFQKHTTKNADRLLRPPGPPGLPFIGNLHHFDGEFPHKYLHALSAQYGPILSLRLGLRQVVVISSSHLVREVMKSDLVFSSRPRLASLQRLSYNGLDIAFSPYNASWREMRRIATLHLFSARNLLSFRPICRDEVSSMMGKMARDASASRATNLSETMLSFANNTICRVAFGRSYGDEGYGKNRFDDVLHETQAVMGGFYVKDYFPLFGWIDELSGMNAKLEKNFRGLDSFYEELIDEHLSPDRPKSMEGDVIDLLLRLQRDGSSSSSFQLTMDHIKALLMASLDQDTINCELHNKEIKELNNQCNKLEAENRGYLAKIIKLQAQVEDLTYLMDSKPTTSTCIKCSGTMNSVYTASSKATISDCTNCLILSARIEELESEAQKAEDLYVKIRCEHCSYELVLMKLGYPSFEQIEILVQHTSGRAQEYLDHFGPSSWEYTEQKDLIAQFQGLYDDNSEVVIPPPGVHANDIVDAILQFGTIPRAGTSNLSRPESSSATRGHNNTRSEPSTSRGRCSRRL